MQNLGFCAVFFHFFGQFCQFLAFFHAKLQFLRGWVIFLSKKATLFWDFIENVRQRVKRAFPERATRAKRESPGREAANTEALYILAFIGERAKRASPNPRAKAFKVGQEGEGAKRHYFCATSLAQSSLPKSCSPGQSR